MVKILLSSIIYAYMDVYNNLIFMKYKIITLGNGSLLTGDIYE